MRIATDRAKLLDILIEPVVPNRTTVRRLLSDAAFLKLAGDPVMVLPARRASRRLACYMPCLLLALAFAQATWAQADEQLINALVPPSPMPEGAVTPVPTPSPTIRLWQDRSLGTLKASLQPTEGELPTNAAAPHLAEAGTRYHCFGESRPWMLASVEWEAAATRHLPLFFEDPNVERLGYTYGFYWNICGCESGPHMAECLQPIVSGVHFWGSIPLIPYLWAIDDPCEPFYTLGVDRPGSPVCYRKHLCPHVHRGWRMETFDDCVWGSSLRKRTQAHSLAIERLCHPREWGTPAFEGRASSRFARERLLHEGWDEQYGPGCATVE